MPRLYKSYAKEAVRLRTGREPDETFLRELYIERRHTQEEIAEAFGVSRALIKKWLKAYGIDREERAPVNVAAVTA